MQTLAVLMSVYHKVDPTEFAEALDSIFTQTRPADEVILVKDGPLTDELEAVIASYGDAITVVPLERNCGLGAALARGLEHVTAEFTARMDTDDVSVPHRFETQLAWFARHPETDALGAAMVEFTGDRELGVRAMPEHAIEIQRYAKINSPMNHPTVMFRTQSVRDAGGYQPIKNLEDYDLWARMLASGMRLHNLQEPLVRFRLDDAVFSRRAQGMWESEVQLQRNLAAYGLISKKRGVFNLLVRTAYRAIPAGLVRRVYQTLFN